MLESAHGVTLAWIAGHDDGVGFTMRELADEFQMPPAQRVSFERSLDRLVRAGFLAATPSKVRPCHDCGVPLTEGEGIIVSPDYFLDLGDPIVTLGEIRLCLPCVGHRRALAEDEQRTALDKVVAYLHDAEERYREATAEEQRDHIFRSVLVLQRLLKEPEAAAGTR